jgi:hypothetical protein
MPPIGFVGVIMTNHFTKFSSANVRQDLSLPRRHSRSVTTIGYRRHDAARGQVFILFALLILSLVGVMALSIDGGFIMAERRQTQSAADAGALAAAISMYGAGTAGEVNASGIAYGALNADVPAGNVEVHWPPLDGTYAGNGGYVQAIVAKDVQKFFVGAVYPGDWSVRASAVAGIEMEQKPYALLALGCDQRNPGIYINGTTDVNIPNGSIMANCDIDSSGTSNTVQVGDTIDAHGTIDGNSNWAAPSGVHEGRPVIDDPLLGTPVPPRGTTVTSTELSAAGFKRVGSKHVCPLTCTISPGYYNNLDEIQAGGTIRLQPGIYFVDGNTRLSLSNTDSWIIGKGVLLYFAKGSTASMGAGIGNIELSAPCLETTPAIPGCSGLAAYPGGGNAITLWIDNCTEFVSGGNGVFRVEGVIYDPCSFVQLHGTPDSNGVQVIVHTLKLVGTSSFNLNYRNYVEADTPKVFLVE